MADFGIYLNVKNDSGKPLFYQSISTSDPDCCKADYPPVIPSNSTGQIHITDACQKGADASVTYANDGPEDRSYSWYAACSSFSPDNQAQGPGVISYNKTGHPLKVTIDVGPVAKQGA